MSTCSQERIIANIESSQYPEKVKLELITFVHELIQRGGAPSPNQQNLDEEK